MSPPGGRSARTEALAGAALAVIAAAIPILVLRGFTVDDALIPARYAVSLARGDGYRASVGAAPSDGVTPLGFAHLLVPFAGGGVAAAYDAARAIGVAAWLAGAAALGRAIARIGGSRWRFAALAIVATSAPLGGWSIAGLETGIVAALVAAGLAAREMGRGALGAIALGVAAAWRPEVAPAAVILAFAAGPGAGGRTASRGAEPDVAAPAEEGEASARDASSGDPGAARARAMRTALALAPMALVAAVRLVAFGRAAPLSALAKAPVLSLGLAYAGAAALLAGFPAVVAPAGLWRASGWTRWLVATVAAHVLAMALAGGDWMPLARLAVPVVPVAVLASARLLAARGPRLPGGAVALGVGVALQIFGFARSYGPTHAIATDRAHLIDEMRPVLAGARVIAAVDVGWIGAAAEHAHVVDLAGITDPTVAALVGGHTARRIPRTLLDDRRVDTVVLLLAAGEDASPREPWTTMRFARGTEAWIASMPGIGDELEIVHVGSRRPRYVVLRRRASGDAR